MVPGFKIKATSYESAGKTAVFRITPRALRGCIFELGVQHRSVKDAGPYGHLRTGFDIETRVCAHIAAHVTKTASRAPQNCRGTLASALERAAMHKNQKAVMNPKVTAIIPFYQRRAGLLAKAVQSALRQTAAVDLSILIVDDASPIPARTELAAELRAHPESIRVIEQANAGPGAARNNALDNVPPGTEFVAFLDSDDMWTADHLANALRALGTGYDFYFADFIRSDWDSTALARCKKFRLADHRKLSSDPEIYEYVGDMVSQILSGNVLGTSVTVYRYSKFPTLRYPTQLRQAGEDIIFWLDLASQTSRIVFSPRCEADYGTGVNICYGARWGTPEFVNVTHDDIRASLQIRKNFRLNPEQRKLVSQNLSRWRKDLTAGLLHDGAARGTAAFSMLMKHIRHDPAYAALCVPLTAAVVGEWVTARFRNTSRTTP
jgi:succinoglycan biosynthesis protein ExoW